MTQIIELKINNFRGIKFFSEKLDKNFICLLGRGDSGKTTILDAIYYVLSPSWNLSFFDSDFYKGNTDNPITIEATLLDVPEKLINEGKYGLHIRGLGEDNKIYDELQQDHSKVLTIRLEVNKSLEPEWFIVNDRQDPIHISAHDRARLNVFMVSDYVDRHFTWSKGNPLYSILKEAQIAETGNSEIVIEAIRQAKEKIDQDSFAQFLEATKRLKESSLKFGIDLSKVKTTVDFRELSKKGGRVCLHDEDAPLRLRGKGSKRLVSMAIQSILVQSGGIVLIDEIEQGLEPDRVKHLVRSLKKDSAGQMFLTTHSSDVITELEAVDLLIVSNNQGKVDISVPKQNFQGLIRACPEAGYAKKVIVCEGKTEIGICRAIDSYRQDKHMECLASKACIYTDGGGHTFSERANKLKELGLQVCVFCDSDDNSLIPSKDDLLTAKIKIFDCEDNYSIEQQVFKDLPWAAINELLDYVILEKNISEEQLEDSIKSKYGDGFPEDFRNTDTIEMRAALGKASNVQKNGWFKRIDHGEYLGDIIFSYFDEMNNNRLKSLVENILAWIDE